MIDFSAVKGVAIPNGEVKGISIGGTMLWQAEESTSTPSYTNLAEPNTTNKSDWSIWCNDARIGSDGAYRSMSGYIVSNYFPVKLGDTIIVEGLTIESSYPTYGLYNANKTKIGTVGWVDYYKNNAYADYENISDTRQKITFKNMDSSLAFVRVCGKLSAAVNDVIITVNEEIG